MKTDPDMTPALDDLTSTVAEVFADVLELKVRADDDFFQSGGTSLAMFAVLYGLEQRLQVKLAVTAVMENPTPQALAEAIRAGTALDGTGWAADADREPPATDSGIRRASRVQEAILAASPNAASGGFLTWVYQLNGRLDVAALAAAIDDVVEAHDVLRTRFERVGGELYTRVERFTPGCLERVSMTGMPKADAITAAVDEARARLQRLHPEREPWFQTTLHEIDRKSSVFAMFVAEALCDSDSATIVASEISRAYAARAATPLPDGVDAETATIAPATDVPTDAAAMTRARQHWVAQAARHDSLGTWPLTPAPTPATVGFTLDESTWQGVVQRARALHAAPYPFVLACFELAFAELAGIQRFLVNAAIAYRRGPGAARMIGAFQIPIRIEADVVPSGGVAVAVEQVKAALRTAVEHCVVPAPLADVDGGRNAPVPAVDFHMFDSHVGPLFTGVRRRRFRLHGDLHREPLLVKSIAGPYGRQDFTLSSATASLAEVESLAASFQGQLCAT